VTLPILALLVLSVSSEQSPLPGCLPPAALAERLTILRSANWAEWSRRRVSVTWPTGLKPSGRDYYTNDIVALARTGRVIDGVSECFEDYLFDTGRKGDVLKQVIITDAESSRAAALAVAESFAASVEPPADAGPTNEVCIDCGDPGQRLVDRLWTAGGWTHSLQIFVRPGHDTYLVRLEWRRRND
jgi:hypothetical protein